MGRPTSFDTLLVANRGEIAARIARTARSLGLRVVGVYSAADRESPHLDAMDEAVAIGGAPAAESYLSIERIVEAARRTGAGAVHPGYGFLSESAELAEACGAAGLGWVGPPPHVLRRMGDKAAAKEAMAAAGLPRVPGLRGSVRGSAGGAELAAAAAALGFPLLVKAAAGGGGRGMRRIERAEQLEPALAEASREAAAAFGRGDLLLERALEDVRHVEVQVVFDAHGKGIHLGERDCSAQRRHQKIVEECPSPALDAARRAEIGRRAVAAARSAGYVGAGTLEFLLDGEGRFWFIEMNPRLQVEHLVTEMVCGVDLVELQLRIAAGEPLRLLQEDVVWYGHAIEARLCAEDPAAGFLPQSGTLLAWRAPEGRGLRVDHALRAGTRISAEYDPLLAKIVARARDREEARRLLVRALERTVVLGVVTNQRFLIDLLASEAFVDGEMTTGLVERWQRERQELPGPGGGTAALLPALAALVLSGAAEAPHGSAPGRGLPWQLTLEGAQGLLELGGERYEDAADDQPRPGAFCLTIGGERLLLEEVAVANGEIRYVRDGVRRTAAFVRSGDETWLSVRGTSASYRRRRGRSAQRTGDAVEGALREEGALRAPMAAQVVEVAAVPGQQVGAGQCLLVLRAMKLEHRVTAPCDAVVEEILVRKNDQVAFRQILARLQSVAPSAAATARGEA